MKSLNNSKRQPSIRPLSLLTLAVVLIGCEPRIEDDRAAEEALYLQRFEQLFSGAQTGEGLGGYDPLRAVPGTKAFAPLPAATPDERTIDDTALEATREYAARNNSSALIVWRNGKVEAEHYFGDVTRETPLVSRSLAKPLGVIAVARAVHAGLIGSIDQPVADYVPEWRDTPKAAIKIRYLLDMRSGLLPQGFETTPESMLNRAYLHPRHDDIIINEYPLTHTPGERYEYSNANSELVAPLLIRATGTSYAEWVTQEVLEPIGALGGSVWINREGGTEHAGCCILLPAETWLRLAILLIQDGVWDGRRLLPEGFVDDMTTATEANPHAGMGLYVAGDYVEWRGAANPELTVGRTYHSEPYLDPNLYLFDGNANQAVFISPAENLIVLRLGTPPPKEPRWDNAYLPNTLIRALND